MLSINSEDKRAQVEMSSIDQLVPKDHLVRKIEAVIDFDFIYDMVKDRYSIVLEKVIESGFVKSDAVFIDATHVKANANKKKFDKVLIERESKSYQELLEKEINDNRLQHNKKPLDTSKKKRS